MFIKSLGAHEYKVPFYFGILSTIVVMYVVICCVQIIHDSGSYVTVVRHMGDGGVKNRGGGNANVINGRPLRRAISIAGLGHF